MEITKHQEKERTKLNLGKMWYYIYTISQIKKNITPNTISKPIFNQNLTDCLIFFINDISEEFVDVLDVSLFEELSDFKKNIKNKSLNSYFDLMNKVQKHLKNKDYIFQYEINSIDIVANYIY